MDYVKELDKAIKNFEIESKKLSNYNNLMDSVLKLMKSTELQQKSLSSNAELIKSANSAFQKTKQSVDKQITANSELIGQLRAMLDEYIQQEKDNKDTLIEDVHKSIRKDAQDIVQQASNPLVQANETVQQATTELQSSTERQQALVQAAVKSLGEAKQAVDREIAINKGLVMQIHTMFSEYIKQDKDDKNRLIKGFAVSEKNQDQLQTLTKENSVNIHQKLDQMQTLIKENSDSSHQQVKQLAERLEGLEKNIIENEKKATASIPFIKVVTILIVILVLVDIGVHYVH